MSMKSAYPYYLANRPVFANEDLEVFDKHSGELATRVAEADDAVVDQAVAAASAAAPAMARLPSWKRRDALNLCADRFEERFEELAEILLI